MRLHEIPNSNGANRAIKRLGRGEGNGHGKTCGRGQKGAKSRSGYSVRPGFEGGQMPLHRKLPHRGFSNFKFRKDFETVNVSQLEKLEASDVTREVLEAAGLVRKSDKPLKVLGEGELSKALKVTASKFTASAKAKIEAAGGQAIEG